MITAQDKGIGWFLPLLKAWLSEGSTVGPGRATAQIYGPHPFGNSSNAYIDADTLGAKDTSANKMHEHCCLHTGYILVVGDAQ